MERQQRVYSCVLRVPLHGPIVNRGFDPIQQQPSHRSRQQWATNLRVPSLWTEKHLDLLGGKTVGVRKYPLICSTLTRSNTLLLTPCSTSLAEVTNYSYLPLWPFTWFSVLNVFCFVIKTPYTETTIIIYNIYICHVWISPSILCTCEVTCSLPVWWAPFPRCRSHWM